MLGLRILLGTAQEAVPPGAPGMTHSLKIECDKKWKSGGFSPVTTSSSAFDATCLLVLGKAALTSFVGH